MKIPVVGFKAHHNPVQPHLNLITAKTQGTSRAIFSSESSGEDFFLFSSYLLVVASSPWHLLACTCRAAISASVLTLMSSLLVHLCLCVQITLSFLLKKTLVFGLMAYSNPVWHHFNDICKHTISKYGPNSNYRD